MAAIILTQIVPAQNVAQQQDQQNSSGTSSGEFAPILDIETKRTQTHNNQNETTEKDNGSAIDETLLASSRFSTKNTTFSPFIDFINGKIDTSSLETVLSSDVPTINSTFSPFKDSTSNTTDISTQEIALSLEFSTKNTVFFPSGNSTNNTADVSTHDIALPSGNSSTELALEILNSLRSKQLLQNSPIQSSSSSPFSTIQTTETATPTVQNNGAIQLTHPSPAETLLIEQIQQLLNKNQNNGPIIIQNTTQHSAENLETLSSAVLASNNSNVQIQQQVTAELTLSGKTPPEANKTTNLEGTRQDVIGQYFKTRIDKAAGQNEGQFQQSSSEQQSNNGQSKEGMQTANLTTPSTPGSLNTIENPMGSQFTLTTPTTDIPQTTVEGKFTPGAHVPIQEHEIVDNLIQRFNVNPRLKTSNLSIQLHPVELGELKINIMVKNDSIKANIIAQSQQILETLEKHMPKLRTVLESQGFSIDTFEITLDSKTDSHQELFQEQFASQQQNNFTDTKPTSQSDNSFENELESVDIAEITESSSSTNSGVNVTV